MIGAYGHYQRPNMPHREICIWGGATKDCHLAGRRRWAMMRLPLSLIARGISVVDIPTNPGLSWPETAAMSTYRLETCCRRVRLRSSARSARPVSVGRAVLREHSQGRVQGSVRPRQSAPRRDRRHRCGGQSGPGWTFVPELVVITAPAARGSRHHRPGRTSEARPAR